MYGYRLAAVSPDAMQYIVLDKPRGVYWKYSYQYLVNMK